MRVDPEGIYLELLPGSTVYNFDRHDFATREAVRLNWKPDPRPGTKWAHQTFLGDSLGEILTQIGTYLDTKGLDALLGDVEAAANGGQ